MENTMSVSRNHSFLNVIVASIIAVSISLVLILIFALMLRFIDIDTSLILPINQGIKIISILLGTIFGFKSNKTKGFLKGMIVGLLYTILAYLIFSLLSFSFNFNVAFLLDLLCATLVGGVSGIIAVNI